MLRLALMTLRVHAGSFVASFLALFFGVVIVMVCGGLLETGIRLDTPPQRLAGAEVVVTGSTLYPEGEPLNQQLAGQVSAIPGVKKVIGDVSFPVVLGEGASGADGYGEGHGWRSTELAPYELRAGREPVGGQVAIDAVMAEKFGLTVGRPIRLLANGREETFIVSGVVVAAGAVQPEFFFAEQDVARLMGRSTVDALGVILSAGVDAGTVARQIEEKTSERSLTVLTGEARGRAEFRQAPASQETLIVLAAVFGGIAITVATLIVASTLSLSVQQRLREMALLRAIGALPSQLRVMIVAETVMIAVLATLAALPFGGMAGRWLMEQLVAGHVVAAQIVSHQGWIPVAAAGGVGLLTAVGAALMAAQRATSVKPVEALGQAVQPQQWVTWRRFGLAALCIAGGVIVGMVTVAALRGPLAASTVSATAVLWAFAIALLAPALLYGVLACLWPLWRLFGLAGQLAKWNTRARLLRVSALLMPIMLATGLASGLLYMQTTLVRTTRQVSADITRSEVAIVSTVGGMSLDDLGKVRRQPGVTAMSPFERSSGFFTLPDGTLGEDADVVTLMGVVAPDIQQTHGFAVAEGSLDQLRGETIVVTVSQAAQLQKKLGDTIPMQLGDGAHVQPKLVATITMPVGYDMVLMPFETLAPHRGTGLASQVFVKAAAGVDAKQLRASLEAAGLPRGALAVEGEEVAELSVQGEQTSVWINYLLAGMVVGYSLIALVNSLIISTMERRRELALQRLAGATKGQIMTMVTAEGVIMLVGGVVLGGLVAVGMLMPFTLGLKGSLLPEGPAWIAAGIVGFIGVLLFGTLWMTAYAALRARPVEAAGNRE